jgi:hypothetical protein
VINAQQGDRLLDFIRCATGDSRLSVLRGLLFEQHGHKALKAGAAVWMRELVASGEGSQPSSGLKRPRVEQEGDEEDEEDEEEEEQEGDVAEEEAEEDEMDVSRPVSHHFASLHQECAYGMLASTSAASAESLQHGMQQLSIAGKLSVRLPRVDHQWDSPELQLSSLDKVYVQPPSTNNPSLDAYYKHSESGQVLLLQYTVSKRHATRAAPVVSFLERLSPEDQQRAKMVFVIPGDNLQQFQIFKRQRWLGKEGKKVRELLGKGDGACAGLLACSCNSDHFNHILFSVIVHG